MSATEIINDLPKLTEAELRTIRRKLVELGAENADVALCDEAAIEGAMMLDQMESPMTAVRDSIIADSKKRTG